MWAVMALGDVRVLLNPTAGAGRAFRGLAALTAALRKYDLTHEVLLTRHPGHATELLRQARDDGASLVAVMGGDGTLNEVVQAYLEVGDDGVGRPVGGPDLALLPAGTGGDFRRTLNLTGGLEEAVARLRHGTRRPVDLGVVRVTGERGEPRVRAFVNVTSFGIGGDVDGLVNGAPKWLGGKVSFFMATLAAMARYRNAPVRIRVDGENWHEGPVFNVAVANGRYFGGGMMIAPHADPSDGKFEVVCLGDLSKASAVALSGRIYQGRHLAAKGVRVAHGVTVEAEPAGPWNPILVDMDGEQPGCLPLGVTLQKGALTFVS